MDNPIYQEEERRAPYKCTEERRIVEIEHAINGNGQEGLKTRVIRIEEKIDSLIKGKISWSTILNIFISLAVLVVMIIALSKGIGS